MSILHFICHLLIDQNLSYTANFIGISVFFQLTFFEEFACQDQDFLHVSHHFFMNQAFMSQLSRFLKSVSQKLLLIWPMNSMFPNTLTSMEITSAQFKFEETLGCLTFCRGLVRYFTGWHLGLKITVHCTVLKSTVTIHTFRRIFFQTAY